MAHRLPSLLRNRLWKPPAAIAVTLLATICSGRLVRSCRYVSAIAQLAIAVVAHGPQAAVALEKQAVEFSCGNRRDVAGHNRLGPVGVVLSAVAQLAIKIVAHGPQTAVALEKQAVEASCGNLGYGLRSAGDSLQHRRTQHRDLYQVPFGLHGITFGCDFRAASS